MRDAKAVAQALREAGFAEVTEGYDLTKPKFDAALKSFGDAATGADWALIYYAGHGIGIGGETSVLPVDAVLKRAEHAEDEAVPLSRLRAKAGGATALRVVILDSCRAIRSPRGSPATLGQNAPSPVACPRPPLLEGDELIAYATRENDVADDGEGQHSPFTTAFLQHLQEQGLEVRFLFGKVRDSVQTATGRAQTPTTYGDLGGAYFYFRAPKPKEETSAPLPPLSEAAEAWRMCPTPAARWSWRRRQSASARRSSAISPARGSPRSSAGRSRREHRCRKRRSPRWSCQQRSSMRTGHNAWCVPSPDTRTRSIGSPFLRTAAHLGARVTTKPSSFGIQRAAGNFAPSLGTRNPSILSPFPPTAARLRAGAWTTR